MSLPEVLLPASSTFSSVADGIITLVPSHTRRAVPPLGTLIPVPDGVFNVAACPQEFCTTNIFEFAGQTTVAAAEGLPAPSSSKVRIAALDSEDAPSTIDNV